MKFLILFGLIAAATADVSHLNNMYLPPHHAGSLAAASTLHKQTEYIQQAEEIPAAPTHQFEQQQTVDVPVQELASNTIEEAVVPEPIGANTYTPTHLAQESVKEEVSFALRSDEQAPAHVAGESIKEEVHFSPAHLGQESVLKEVHYNFDKDTHAPAIATAAHDTVADYVLSQSENVEQHVAASSGIDTVYGSNGGYVY